MKDNPKQYKLFLELAQHIEIFQSLPPLAARIVAYMLVYCKNKEGRSFEELIEIFDCSKSSISCNLSMLLERKNIEYYYLEDTRKRYFRLNSKFMLMRLSSVFDMLNKEYQLNKSLVEVQSEDTDFLESRVPTLKIYTEHLTEIRKIFSNTIEKLKTTL